MPNAPLPHGTPFCGFKPQAGGGLTINSLVPLSYGLKGAGRGSPKLSWSFSGTVTGVKTPATQITQAFNLWASAAPALHFTNVTSNADITIGVGNAGTVPGGTALAVTSSDGRTITISNAVTFVASGAANDFLNVITHEIGHALGLLHATTPASIMYPFSSTTETLQPDDTHAIQALYSWSPQRKLQGGTEQVPAICACGATLMMAWRGTGNDHNIWVATCTDGQNWTPQRTIPGAASIGGPALAWDGARVWMAWRGTVNDDSLYWANSTDFFQRQTTGVQHLGDRGSSHGPRIAIVNDVPSMVWKGVNNDTGIYFSTFTGGRWGGQNHLQGLGTSSAPAICQDVLGGARLVWKGSGSDSTLWNTVVSANGVAAPQSKVAWTVLGNGSNAGAVGYPGSTEGPGLTLARGRIVMIWRGVQGDDGLWFTQLANDTLPNGRTAEEWSDQAHIANTGAWFGASITEFNSVLHAVWKGIENDTGIYSATL